VRAYRLTFAQSGFHELAPASFQFYSDPMQRGNFESAFLGCWFPNCCEASGAGRLSECFFSASSFLGACASVENNSTPIL
jgi:hypothetical protein